ncbi:MAG: GDP-mannose 4,6-dehydratase [Candidatus Delongbacteria bacterium]|nr:GDP-mannose 4,6-dehydratase [Candidatus Delongbacteria bacterium]MBN2836444.1 GDP-mannose 4,6-dehydratase [Candidatus Delongbacteria bacterium]
MRLLITGTAGFIGYHLSKTICQQNTDLELYCLDNINDYYDTELKFSRLDDLGFKKELISENNFIPSQKYEKLYFYKCDLENRENIKRIFHEYRFDIVCNLAAQAGVRYSLQNPYTYIDSNISGFLNILENCRNFNVKKLVYASSSSVYGNSDNEVFKTSDRVDNPISLYAATKKSNELMAYTYSHLFNIETIGLRFFTVYGPWGRPDMAYYSFTNSILQDKPIKVFNNGDLARDFTYIDDIVEGIRRIIFAPLQEKKYSIYNIGNGKPVNLLEFIQVIESELNKEAIKEYVPMQPGDVSTTHADVTDLENFVNYKPKTSLQEGIRKFIGWYRDYYKS